MWRAGLRVQEALALTEGDLDQRRGSLLVRRGKGGRRREVGMDAWALEQLQPWLELRATCRSARCCASSPVRPAGAIGLQPPPALSCGASPPRRRNASGEVLDRLGELGDRVQRAVFAHRANAA